MSDPINTPGIPTLREAKMHLVNPVSPCIGTVVSTHRCTASKKAAGFIRHVAIDISGTPIAGNYISGQSFGVLPPGLDAAGKPHKLRLYSIASPTRGEDGQGNILATTVKRTIDEHNDHHRLFLGVASNYLCDLQIGDKVNITGPSGKRFVLPADLSQHDFLFLATGTGIAPFRGMLLDILNDPTASNSKTALIMGSPYATDLLYHQDLLDLAKSNSNFTYATAISREVAANGPTITKPMYVHDRVSALRDQLASMLASPRTLIYICGIAGMEMGIFQTLATILPPESLHQYIQPTPEAGDPKTWDRKMLHKQIAVTRRVFLEVY